MTPLSCCFIVTSCPAATDLQLWPFSNGWYSAITTSEISNPTRPPCHGNMNCSNMLESLSLTESDTGHLLHHRKEHNVTGVCEQQLEGKGGRLLQLNTKKLSVTWGKLQLVSTEARHSLSTWSIIKKKKLYDFFRSWSSTRGMQPRPGRECIWRRDTCTTVH